MQRKLCNRIAGLSLTLLILGIAHLAAEETLPVEEVERGMKAIGWSVFAGQEPEPFEAELLGVWKNIRPDTSYVLARLSGQGLEKSGVIAGMSGSPVYVDDKLVGAVAFSWSFASDAIAGITPIAAMRRLHHDGPSAPSRLAGPMPSWSDLVNVPGDPNGLSQTLGLLQGGDAGQSTNLMWSTVGLPDSTREFLSAGLGTVLSGGESSEPATALKPGSAVAAMLVDGDLKIAATGTVTDVENEYVLAFGHSFLGVGSIAIPMATAEIVTVIPSLANSFKVGNLGEVVGSFDRDRTVGIRGAIGVEAPHIPMQVSVVGDRDEAFDLKLAQVDALTGSLAATSLLGALDTANGSAGDQTTQLRAEIALEDRPSLRVRQTFDGPSSSLESAVHLFNLISYVLNNETETVAVKDIQVEVTQRMGRRLERIRSVRSSRRVVRPGDSVELFIEVEPIRGERRIVSQSVNVPLSAEPGRYMFLVGDGVSVDGARIGLEGEEPQTFDGALELLNGLHDRSQLVVSGLVLAPGMSLNGSNLQRLPPSMQKLLGDGAQPSSAVRVAFDEETVVEWGGPLDGLVRVDVQVMER